MNMLLLPATVRVVGDDPALYLSDTLLLLTLKAALPMYEEARISAFSLIYE